MSQIQAPGLPEDTVQMRSDDFVTTPATAGVRGRLDVAALARRAGRDSLYVLTAFPLALAGFVSTVAGVATGFGTLIVWVGLPILALTLLLSSRLAQLERRRLVRLQGKRPQHVHYLDAPGERVVRRMTTVLRDPQRWLDTAWGLVTFVSSTALFCLAVTWWALAVLGTTAWVLPLWVADEQGGGLSALIGLGDGRGVEATLNIVIGVLAFLALPWVMRPLAWVQSSLAQVVLNSRGELNAQVRQAQGARAAAQQAEAVALRRLERDIHDGPQQRLVRLTMDLGRAKRQIGTDPDLAADIVDQALGQARETLDELRALSRGIAPPLLVDRGLGVALDELVVRSAVPVEIRHDLPAGLSPHVETAVYFTVSEALTNVAKHSGAPAAQVFVRPEGDTLLVQVRDAGVGGAHTGKGQGLAGLHQRIAAVEGTFAVDSPLGGPTTLTARIPLT
jgi:signal transduction histidine kinase